MTSCRKGLSGEGESGRTGMGARAERRIRDGKGSRERVEGARCVFHRNQRHPSASVLVCAARKGNRAAEMRSAPWPKSAAVGQNDESRRKTWVAVSTSHAHDGCRKRDTSSRRSGPRHRRGTRGVRCRGRGRLPRGARDEDTQRRAPRRVRVASALTKPTTNISTPPCRRAR